MHAQVSYKTKTFLIAPKDYMYTPLAWHTDQSQSVSDSDTHPVTNSPATYRKKKLTLFAYQEMIYKMKCYTMLKFSQTTFVGFYSITKPFSGMYIQDYTNEASQL